MATTRSAEATYRKGSPTMVRIRTGSPAARRLRSRRSASGMNGPVTITNVQGCAAQMSGTASTRVLIIACPSAPPPAIATTNEPRGSTPRRRAARRRRTIGAGVQT